jgi:uncharacterized membrane protein
MRHYLVAYLSTFISFCVIDFGWLSFAGSRLYAPRIGDLLLAKPNLPAAVVFYLLYVVGIIVFAVEPAARSGTWLGAAKSGALLGFFAYATYDLTNQATLRGWTSVITLADMTWGTVLTGTAATLGYLATRRFG